MSNPHLLIVPQRQFEILGALHPQWPTRCHQISDKVGIPRRDIYTHMAKVTNHGWVTVQRIKVNGHAHPVPHYRISDLGLAALEYGRREREED